MRIDVDVYDRPGQAGIEVVCTARVGYSDVVVISHSEVIDYVSLVRAQDATALLREGRERVVASVMDGARHLLLNDQ